MAEHRFRLVNVFTRGREALSGNPLCVFEDGASLDTDTMQALALQFNLSETSFILPSSVADARVRDTRRWARPTSYGRFIRAGTCWTWNSMSVA
jgi:PhzF family phenazine biosynthesis protein